MHRVVPGTRRLALSLKTVECDNLRYGTRTCSQCGICGYILEVLAEWLEILSTRNTVSEFLVAILPQVTYNG
jgi:hypothetical protein